METYEFVISGLIGLTLLCIVGVVIYVYVSIRKINQEREKDREDLYKLILYVQLYDKVLYNLVRYIEGGKHVNLMDLAEFKDVDPKIKEKYKTYVVDILMKSITDYINKNRDSPMLSDAELESMVGNIGDMIDDKNI